MVIDKPSWLLLAVFVALNIGCVKPKTDCPKFGYEYIYFKTGVEYTPGLDSIELGNDLILQASVPKSFYDSTHNINVTLETSFIQGSLIISRATGNNISPTEGAIDNFEITPQIGSIFKDSATYTPFQLRSIRTVHWGNTPDSFRLSIKLKTLTRGVFFINLNQQGNRDADCALFKYFVKVKNPDQHLYFLEQITGGYVSDNARNFLYAFKVF